MTCRVPSFLKIFLLPATAALALACAGTEAEPGGVASELRVTRGQLVREHLLSGELAAEHAVDLVAPDANVWPLQIRWLAEDGVEVRAGDLLVEFDNSSLTGDLEEKKLQVVQAQNALLGAHSTAAAEEEQAAFTLAQKRADLEKARIRADVPEELVTGRDYQERQVQRKRAELEAAEAERNLKTKRKSGEADVGIKRLAYDTALREIREAEAGISKMSLTAPRDGILVVERDRREGRTYQAGDTVWPGLTIARLPDLDSLVVRARLSDVDDGRIRPGMEARVTMDAYPELEFTAQVREIDQIAHQASRSSSSRYFGVLLDLESLDPERMVPGMSVRVVIEEPLGESLLVPRESLDLAAAPPRVLLANGSWVEAETGTCADLACTLAPGAPEALAEGTRLGRTGDEPDGVETGGAETAAGTVEAGP